MRDRAVRLGMTLWLAGCLCRAVCQSPAPAAQAQPATADFSVYESFFQRVVQQRDLPRDAPVLLRASPAIAGALADQSGDAPKDARVLVNGQPTDLKPAPTVQEATGLTDQEMQLLQEIAADCGAMTQPIRSSEGALWFDSVIESIQLGKDAVGPAEQRVKDLEEQRDQVVRDHVERIKIVLGESGFEKIDAFVHNPNPGAPRGVPMKKQ